MTILVSTCHRTLLPLDDKGNTKEVSVNRNSSKKDANDNVGLYVSSDLIASR